MGTAKRDLRTSGDLVMAPRVPHGLAAAVEGLTREVIRHRPEDIYVFAAQHFEELLKLRNGYGAVGSLPGRSGNTAALREINESLKKRSGTDAQSPGEKSMRERSGWSMNETARVLERHRSIFGDKGRKVSTEEVRALGNEKENKVSRGDDAGVDTFPVSQKRRGSSERFVKRRVPRDADVASDNKSKSDSNGNPKIISQIPTLTGTGNLLAKDIKSELRKNRNSSKDSRSTREVGSRHPGGSKKTLMRSSREKSLDKFVQREKEDDKDDLTSVVKKETNATDNQKQKTDAKALSRSLAKIPRTLSMDRVRGFVLDKFRSSESLEELRSTNYVDRVQEVIDDAAPSILRRVREMSARSSVGQISSRGYESVDESTSTSTRSDKSNQTDDVRSRSAMSATRRSRKSTRRRSRSKSEKTSAGADSLEGIETLASESEPVKQETKSEIAEGTKSVESRGSLKGLAISKEEERIGSAKRSTGNGESDASNHPDGARKASVGSPSVSLPAVRPPSSKNTSRSVSRTDSDNLVLPPIPPELPRSPKKCEELVLPSLQASVRIPEPKDGPLDLRTIDGDPSALIDAVEVELILPDAPTEEIFKDSLNVTPDIGENASPRPDSLEPDEHGDNIAELKSKLNEVGTFGADQASVGITERLREIEETEKKIENIRTAEPSRSSIDNAGAASVTEKLVEIQEPEERLRNAINSSAKRETQKIQGVTIDVGVKEKLIEIQEAEKRIEKILQPEDQDTRNSDVDVGVKEKLVEVEKAEKRIDEILRSELRDIHKEENCADVKEKPIEVKNTEINVEETLQRETQEILKSRSEAGMKEKFMEIDETEKRIEKILHPEIQETRDDGNNAETKEKPAAIENTVIIIETPSDSACRVIPRTGVDAGIREKLMEIEATEQRIEKILHPKAHVAEKEKSDCEVKAEPVMNTEATCSEGQKIQESRTKPAEFMKEKLMEVEEASKRLRNLDLAGKEGKLDQIGTAHHGDGFENPNDPVTTRNSVPKTPFILEIPTEYVTTTSETDTIKVFVAEVEVNRSTPRLGQNTESSTNAGEDREEKSDKHTNESKTPDAKSDGQQLPSGTPDSLGNSYVLTEGSPYEIPDSVTTVVIPDRQTDTPSSETLEIVIEEQDIRSKTSQDTEESREISLRNILDNFGEIVHQEATIVGSPHTDVDFIRGLKTSNEVIIPRQDLDLIREEDDKEVMDSVGAGSVVTAPMNAVTPTLDDIAETEEIDDASENRETVAIMEYTKKSIPEDVSRGLVDEEAGRSSENRDNGSLESSRVETENRAEVEGPWRTTSPTMTSALGLLQRNITDSTTTESTDEVKETTISDDGGKTAPESSVTSPSCAVNIGPRNSESSNEVKETTITDQPAEDGGKNLYSLVPQCHGSMPHVPELNLDSLQDITVSSFQLSDDPTAEEDSDAGKPSGENETSALIKGADENKESVCGDTIVQENVVVREDPCTKVVAYITQPDANVIGFKSADIDGESNSATLKLGIGGGEKKVTAVVEKMDEVAGRISETVDKKETEKAPENISEKMVELVNLDVVKTEHGKVDEEVLEKESEKVHGEWVKKQSKVVLERGARKELSDMTVEIREEFSQKEPAEVHEKLSKNVSEQETVTLHEDLPGKVIKTAVAEIQSEVVKDKKPQTVPEGVSANVTVRITNEVHEELAESKPEDVHQELAKSKPEEVHEELDKIEPEEVHEELAKGKPEEVHKELDKIEPEEPREELTKKELEEMSEKGERKIVEEIREKEQGESIEKVEEINEEVPVNTVDKMPTDDDDKSMKKEPKEQPKVESKKVDEMVHEAQTTKEKIEGSSVEELQIIRETKMKHEGMNEKTTDDAKLVSQSLQIPEGIKTPAVSAAPVAAYPPKAEVVTNILVDDGTSGERMEYHIYVPELTASEESTTESSTFNSAATKIQAGVRGFLTRRRLQSAQRRSSTLDSVPSIQDSVAADAPHPLEPIEEVGLAQAATTIQSGYRGYKARQRLRREDAVQKTTLSVESAFSGNGLQHTGEFHDCIPLPVIIGDTASIAVNLKPVVKLSAGRQRQRPESSEYTDDTAMSRETAKEARRLMVGEDNNDMENREGSIEKNHDSMESTSVEGGDVGESSFRLIVEKYPHANRGLNLVVVSSNDAVLQSQYLNFITSIEEVTNDTDSLVGPKPNLKVIEDLQSLLKSTAGVESLPVDNTSSSDVSAGSSTSIREPLAVSGTPATGVVIEELSKTEEKSMVPDVITLTSVSNSNDVNKSVTNTDDANSDAPGDSLVDLPGLSLETSRVTPIVPDVGKETEAGVSVEERPEAELQGEVPQDGSLGTMSFSMNVDDMLGLGAESDPSSKMKPIFEVTVTPRDLLKLTSNRSQGSQASGERAESPVTMMQTVPKSVEEKSDRSEDERFGEPKSSKGKIGSVEDSTPIKDSRDDSTQGRKKNENSSSEETSRTYSNDKSVRHSTTRGGKM
nr:titin [Neodiprion pinetum]